VNPNDPGSEEEHGRPEEEEEEKDIVTAVVPLTNDSSSLHEHLPASNGLKFFMNLQLALILFLSFFCLYEHGWERMRAALEFRIPEGGLERNIHHDCGDKSIN
jgi:hypothetical protein